MLTFGHKEKRHSSKGTLTRTPGRSIRLRTVSTSSYVSNEKHETTRIFEFFLDSKTKSSLGEVTARGERNLSHNPELFVE